MIRLAVTPGEPAGIGPDLLVMQAQRPAPYRLIAIADRELLLQRAAQLNLPLQCLADDGTDAPANAGELFVQHTPMAEPAIPGALNPANASYLLATLDTAIDGCLAGHYHGLVTGPVQKSVINDAGIPFSGHTEYLAQRTDCNNVVMMLAAPGLRVALVTTHLPLRDVADHITDVAIRNTAIQTWQHLQRDLGIAQPRILVCGLNPHAGEGGHLGQEEITLIQPVLNALRQEGLNLTGPLPADTLFTPHHLQHADAVIAMYHDQGLPVLKHLGFGQAVNISLGLPLIRTSVDHGTALDLAATGRIDQGSLAAAIRYAAQMVQQRQVSS